MMFLAAKVTKNICETMSLHVSAKHQSTVLNVGISNANEAPSTTRSVSNEVKPRLLVDMQISRYQLYHVLRGKEASGRGKCKKATLEFNDFQWDPRIRILDDPVADFHRDPLANFQGDPRRFSRGSWRILANFQGHPQGSSLIFTIDYKCDDRRFSLSAHDRQVPTPTSQNLDLEQQIRILEAN
jgi:hypothetical protein